LAADYALLGGWRGLRSAVVSGVTSRRLRFPRPWWRGYGLQCCSRISVALGLNIEFVFEPCGLGLVPSPTPAGWWSGSSWPARPCVAAPNELSAASELGLLRL